MESVSAAEQDLFSEELMSYERCYAEDEEYGIYLLWRYNPKKYNANKRKVIEREIFERLCCYKPLEDWQIIHYNGMTQKNKNTQMKYAIKYINGVKFNNLNFL
jgi:hypothetical protein